jgi:hypothetical protein
LGCFAFENRDSEKISDRFDFGKFACSEVNSTDGFEQWRRNWLNFDRFENYSSYIEEGIYFDVGMDFVACLLGVVVAYLEDIEHWENIGYLKDIACFYNRAY